MRTLHFQTEAWQKSCVCRSLHSANRLLCLQYSHLHGETHSLLFWKLRLPQCRRWRAQRPDQGATDDTEILSLDSSEKDCWPKGSNLVLEHVSTPLCTFSTQKEKCFFPKLNVKSICCKGSQFFTKPYPWVLGVKPGPLRSTGPDSRYRLRQVNTTAELKPQYHTYHLWHTQKAQKYEFYLGLRLKSCKDNCLNCFEILKTDM